MRIKMKINNWKFINLVFWFALERVSGWPTACLVSINTFFLKKAIKAALRVKAAKGEDYEKLEADFVKDCSFLFKKQRPVASGSKSNDPLHQIQRKTGCRGNSLVVALFKNHE